jgi:hypothetical protein
VAAEREPPFDVEKGMNWARGFFRLWLVLSALWIGAMAWTERDQLCSASHDRRVEAVVADSPLVLARIDETLLEGAYHSLVDCLPPRGGADAWWRSREPVLLMVLGPPIGAFIFGCVLLWVGRGFRLTR